MKKLLLIFLCIFTAITSAEESSESVKIITMENTLFNSLIGQWSIEDSSLDKQGAWQKGQGADWNWYKILDGHAIQDDWIAPALDQKLETGTRQFGTNIRIYNPKNSQWEMAWISSASQKLDTFKAVESHDKIVMTGFYTGANSRITFFNITAQAFDWKLELEQKNKSWLEVYRIKGKRK